jgi:hypothetical protein
LIDLQFVFFQIEAQALPATNDWKANWISCTSNVDSVNSWTAFRKTFTLDEKPSSARVRIAVDSKYWLWVNSQLIVFEGGLKRGPTPFDTYFDEVELAPYLKTGKNTVAVLVRYFGKDGFSHKSSGRSGLIFDL